SVTYSSSTRNTFEYNYTILGSSTGLSWINSGYAGTLTGDANEQNDTANHITWVATTPTGISKIWTNGGGTNKWNNASNWSPTGVPGAIDWVTFNSSSTADCTVDTPVS